MILQPLVAIMICIVVATAMRGVTLKASVAAFAAVYVVCAAAQVEGAASTASVHIMPTTDKTLFAWLNANSETGAVIVTTDLRLATILPLYTHDGTLMANGSRTLASNEELIERYLLVNKLVQTPDSLVRSELSQGITEGSPLPVVTYSEFLFETAPIKDPVRWSLTPEATDKIVNEYQQMNPAAELQHFRVDYVWLSSGTPVQIPDRTWNNVFVNSAGSLWQIHKNAGD
jgi:hypothetical protein